MINHPIIKALREDLAKERLDIAAQCTTSPRDKFDISRLSHEAATARLLALLTKAVELLQEINIDNPSFEDLRIEWMEIQIDKRHAQEIREFLTTLTDASGEMNKDGE